MGNRMKKPLYLKCSLSLLTHSGLNHMANNLLTFFNVLSSETFYGGYFDSKFSVVCLYASTWHQIIMGSANGLVWKQVISISWANDDPVHWLLFESLSLGIVYHSHNDICFTDKCVDKACTKYLTNRYEITCMQVKPPGVIYLLIPVFNWLDVSYIINLRKMLRSPLVLFVTINVITVFKMTV